MVDSVAGQYVSEPFKGGVVLAGSGDEYVEVLVGLGEEVVWFALVGCQFFGPCCEGFPPVYSSEGVFW